MGGAAVDVRTRARRGRPGPRTSARTRSTDARKTSSGVPICSIRAVFMTTMRSDIVRASSWSCVTYMNVTPSVRCRRRNSTCMRSRSRGRARRAARRAGAPTAGTERAGQRDALLRPPESCVRPPVAGPSSRRGPEPPPRANGARARERAGPQRIGDILRHAHVRKQRVALEHHAEAPALGRQRRDVHVGGMDRATRRLLEAGEHHHSVVLPEPLGQERNELAVRTSGSTPGARGHRRRRPCGGRAAIVPWRAPLWLRRERPRSRLRSRTATHGVESDARPLFPGIRRKHGAASLTCRFRA